MKDTGRQSTMTELDVTQEMRDLRQAVADKEKHLENISGKLERLKRVIADFRDLYDRKVRRLYAYLDDLEYQLFKYYHISEFVDELFSFSEAEDIFEETMKSRRAQMEDEYFRQRKEKIITDRKNLLSLLERDELKRLYRKLARLFHPDRTGGDEQMMVRINKAYTEGDLEALRCLELEHVSGDADTDSVSGLRRRLSNLTERIGQVRTEMRELRKSDMFVLKRNLMKTYGNSGNPLDDLVRQIRKDIRRKEDQLERMKEKFDRQNSGSVDPVK